MHFAPVVLFVYSRPTHTRELLLSLSKCQYATDTDLYIYSDAAKSEKALPQVQEVREIINDVSWKPFFKSITIIEAHKNKGLAGSVISGVTEVIHKHGRVIVVEDDNRVAPDFLDYMDRALDFYADDSRIGFIGAYTAPISFPASYHHDVFAMGRGSSYSWATWQEMWDLVDWEVKDFPEFASNKSARRKFNEYGEDRFDMLKSQMEGRIDSWAIRFAYGMFKQDKLAILPTKTRVENSGFDGTGVHNVSADTRFLVKIEKDLQPVVFEHVSVDDRIKKEFCGMFKISPYMKLKRKLKRIFR